ncbi:siphovirus Gp157 family protein [Lactobacillus rhamnosus]|uniref:Siphovirus Gp157 family protein n=1 Tax=Lacticaseibacillus rhamnosus TaxID=47715 RepID=A0A7Y7UKH6_LACRH|nr:siphovirus Gp157 family protein [Lacticaseibacillus rhamnosus]NVO88916.1 siphovirus Gp157 family protein [Lacticaseibacillus rhamnosus]
MATLYKLKTEEQQVLDLGEQGKIDPQVFNDTLESIQGTIEEKLVSYIKVAEEADAKVAALKKKRDAFNERLKSNQRLSDRLRATVLNEMVTRGSQSIEDSDVSIKVRKKPASVEVFDAEKLPAYLWREKTQMVPDKSEIAKRLKAGDDIDGARLVPGNRLEVK